ncbi:Putative lipoprotein RzoQ [Klebsiella michiganensis]
MLKHKPLQRVLLPIISLALLSSCASRQKTLPPAWTPQNTPQVLPLPSEAKQPVPPQECSPTCSEILQKKLDDMLQSLTNATQQE